MGKAEEALVKAEEIRQKSIQDHAMEMVPDAMKTLGKFARGQKVRGISPTASVTRQSARDIIEFAGGRPETRDPRIGDSGQQVNIFIQQFGSDEARRMAEAGLVKEIPLPPAPGTPDATLLEAEVARTPTITRKFEVPDAPPVLAEDPIE